MSAVYTSIRPDGSEETMDRAGIEAEYAAAAQNCIDNDDWGDVLDENGLRCQIIMSARLVEGEDDEAPDLLEEFWHDLLPEILAQVSANLLDASMAHALIHKAITAAGEETK